jgi:hypothetical protein
MDFWITFSSIVLLSLIYPCLLNLNHFLKIKKLHKTFQTDIHKFIEEYQLTLTLFKLAGLEDGNVQAITKSKLVLTNGFEEFPQYEKHNISLFDNLTYQHSDVTPTVNGLFLKAKGVYQNRLKECISPLFWIQFILQFPSQIMEYLGLKENNLVVKIIQLIYWGLGIVKILNDLKLVSIPSFA